ncbi:Z1 domain-containing protein [Salinispira pacifica]|uniref:Endonuclease n=1 Tax=Salinispira pacifica TaxID=1307761 RepID=V5WE64_9SPIO|nr:Z1 domain-containing protein [Salinispira pacifica]AHC14088.1 Endonuclease [Salinispira pacifica]
MNDILQRWCEDKIANSKSLDLAKMEIVRGLDGLIQTWSELRSITRTELLRQVERFFQVREQEVLTTIPRSLQNIDPVDEPLNADSFWYTYKKNLVEKKWPEDEIYKLGISCRKIAATLNSAASEETDLQDPPLRGLAIGHVQSGKTASMAGVISLAFDYNYDLVIVLSGTIESLRKQTQVRLSSDLRGASSRTLVVCDRLNRKPICLPQNIFSGKNCVLNVCLKNSTRLRQTKRWLEWVIESKYEPRILIIDDEADQGGINTQADRNEVTTVAKLIREIVHIHPVKTSYLAYTATPYANLLNEAPDADNGRSLYPRHAIFVLEPGKGYFGAKEIFGMSSDSFGEESEDGLNIIRYVLPDEVKQIQNIQKSLLSDDLPESLKYAIIWFLCSVAVRRYRGHGPQPTTMLIHTSHRTIHHTNLAESIQEYLQSLNSSNHSVEKIKKVWDSEMELAPDLISELPEFEKLDFSFLLNKTMGDRSPSDFHSGIHFCIDNGNQSRENRLNYPDETWRGDFSPAFIVIGGNTLARGLTLEGLVSTFFLRVSKTSDTLMQMGRWFGYRRGYDDLPRIWMTPATVSIFQFISRVDQELREQIKTSVQDPSQMAPVILHNPDIIQITPKNKRSAASNDISYGISAPQTIYLAKDPAILRKNIELTTSFENLLRESYSKNVNPDKPCVIYRGVPVNMISEYITNFVFWQNQRAFQNPQKLAEWLVDSHNKFSWNDWNVVFVNPDSGEDSGLEGFSFTWRVSNRSAVYDNDKMQSYIYIKSLRGPGDILLDLDIPDDLTVKNTAQGRREYLTSKDIKQPLLLLYMINKSSSTRKSISMDDLLAKPEQDRTNKRVNLSEPEHIIALSLFWPGGKELSTNYIQIDLDGFVQPESDADINDAEDEDS